MQKIVRFFEASVLISFIYFGKFSAGFYYDTKKETFIGRSERIRRRDRKLCSPNANLSSARIENDKLILREIFQCALNVFTRTFNNFDCGCMDL